MGWHELYTRANQEFSKRSDLALFRAGISPFLPPIGARKATHPKFFFDEEGARKRALLVCKHLPNRAEQIVHEADKTCRHQFDLLGYEKLQYGSEIDWHADPVHGKRSPLEPWFKIDFLDFNKFGDHKIVWELNRHQHLVTLAEARLFTNNAHYTREIVTQWYSWQKANPYPLGINWASSLEVAFRSLSWLWLLHLLAECLELTASFRQDLLLALRLNGRHIEKYLSTYFSPNTHLLGEAVALFFIGTLCPEISAARRWQTKGWEILLEESKRQVRSDGIYFEQALYYHVYALDFFLHARHLAYINGISIPDHFDETLRKMLNIVQALSETGTLEGFGDDDGGRVFDPRRNRIEHMTDPLALGAVTYDCSRYSTFGLTEEAVWLFGEKAISMFASFSAHRNQAESEAFPSGGIYLINDCQPDAQQLAIDAGPQGTARSGHGHADALSVRFLLGGRRLLIDPGTYCYVPGEDRNQFRGTAAHNTLQVDNLDQATPAGPFAWESIPQTTTESWRNGRTFDFFSGAHDGYCRLPEPVLHRRSVFHVKGGIWLIHDSAEGQGNHLLEISWHFAPDVMVTQAAGVILAKADDNRESSKTTGLAMLWDSQSQWKSEITQGFVSHAYGKKQSAPVLRMSMQGPLPRVCGIVFISLSEGNVGKLITMRGEEVRGYRYERAQSMEFLFFSSLSSPWKLDRWTSDARLLYCKIESNRLAHMIMIDGSFAAWDGSRFVSQSSRCPSFEWLKSSELRRDSPFPKDSTEDRTVVELDFSDAGF
jgi:hypothetical protein